MNARPNIPPADETFVPERFYNTSAIFVGKVREYLERLLREGVISSDAESILDMGCGWAEEAILLENLFPKAQIIAIDNSKNHMETARAKMRGKTLRTAFVLDDLNKRATYRKLPKADLVIIQQPELAGDNPVSLFQWVMLCLEKLKKGQKVVVCFCNQADLDAYRAQTNDIEQFYTVVYDKPNSDSCEVRGLFHIVVLEKK